MRGRVRDVWGRATRAPEVMSTLNVLALNCTLKKSPASSSTDKLAGQVVAELERLGATCTSVRVADHDIHPGVSTDVGDGDEWPQLRAQVLAADVLVMATPIWLGQPSSVCKRVLERLDAELAETQDDGRPSMFDKVAMVAVVGNEDGAHHVTAEVYQALSDVGFTIPAQAVTYWVGEAMQATDYQDLDETPEKVATTTKTAAANAVHLATLLKEKSYPQP